jgi:hypothetical protein
MRADPRTSGPAGARPRSAVGASPRRPAQSPVELAAEVAKVLAGMTYEERVRAYRSAAITPRELSVAAGRHPEEMPLLNGEYEWIAISLADLE